MGGAAWRGGYGGLGGEKEFLRKGYREKGLEGVELVGPLRR